MKMKRILLGINIFYTFAFAQNYHGKIISNRKQGDTVQIPIVVRQIDLDKNTSLSFVSADSMKPATVGIVFASDDSVGDSYATILNPLGSDIPLLLSTNSQFINAVNQYKHIKNYEIASATGLNDPMYVINQHKVIGIAELSWDMFELFCHLDSIQISTKCRVIGLNNKNREIISEFYLYLVEREERPPDFVPYEKEPTLLKRVEPKYPESALRDSLEGTVFLKAWVDRKGRVHGAEVLKSSDDVFVAPAIEAVKQWVFTPALIKGEPVSVWVSFPFRYRLPVKK